MNLFLFVSPEYDGEQIEFVSFADEVNLLDAEKCLSSRPGYEDGAIIASIDEVFDREVIDALDLMRDWASRHHFRIQELFVPEFYRGQLGSFNIKCGCTDSRVQEAIAKNRQTYIDDILKRLPVAELTAQEERLREMGFIYEADSIKVRIRTLQDQTEVQVDRLLAEKDFDHHFRTKLGPDPECEWCKGTGHKVITP